MTSIIPQDLYNQTLILIDRQVCGKSLHEFVKAAWHVIEPGVPYVDGPHIQAICEHLQAITDGEIRFLLINIPPRHAKSTIVSVLWPCWEWINRPQEKYLTASYSGILSTRDNLKARRLITSPWYQARWGNIVQLSGDQNQKTRFENTVTGYRIASSVGGTATGEGGSRLICLHPDTLIQCRDGQRKISDVVDSQVSVEVLGYDHDTDTAEWRAIDRFERSNGRRMVRIKTATRDITVTHDHPVYVVGKGYIDAEKVMPNDSLVSYSGKLAHDTVVSVEEAPQTDYVYNVAVSKTHNYFAGGLLLHNCDDPHSAQEAQSDAMRESAIEWFDMVWSTRMNNPKRDAMVTIMQRLHEQDVSGRIEELGGWEHLCLPAEWDGVRRKTSLGYYDKRKTEGELLWPARFGKAEIDKLKAVLGEYGVAGQLQQKPAPMGGGILKPDRFRLWPNTKALPPFEYILQSYDTAFTASTQNDPTACTVWGLFYWEGCYNVMVIDSWHDYLEYPDLRARVIKEWTAKYAGDKTDPTNKARSPDLCLIEKKGSGQSLLQDLAQAKIVVAEYNPGNADKISRAHMITPLLDAGLVWIPEGKRGDTWPTWADPLMKELSRFPKTEHDDYADSVTQALRYIRDLGYLSLARTNRYDDEARPQQTQVINPYAQ